MITFVSKMSIRTKTEVCFITETAPSCVLASSSALPWALDSVLQYSVMRCFCHTSNPIRYKNTLNPAKLFNHRPASTLTTPLQDWSPPSPLLQLLDVPCPVDRCCSCSALLVSTKRTAALPWRGPDHCSRTCSHTHRQCRRNIFVANLIYIGTL